MQGGDRSVGQQVMDKMDVPPFLNWYFSVSRCRLSSRQKDGQMLSTTKHRDERRPETNILKPALSSPDVKLGSVVDMVDAAMFKSRGETSNDKEKPQASPDSLAMWSTNLPRLTACGSVLPSHRCPPHRRVSLVLLLNYIEITIPPTLRKTSHVYHQRRPQSKRKSRERLVQIELTRRGRGRKNLSRNYTTSAHLELPGLGQGYSTVVPTNQRE